MSTSFLDLIKSYGPNLAGWVLLFVFFAWMMGQGGRMAMRNVKAILDEGESLREKMRAELHDCQAAQRLSRRHLTEMTNKWEKSREDAHQLRNEMANLVLEIHRLTAETHRLTTEAHQLNVDLTRERLKRKHDDAV